MAAKETGPTTGPASKSIGTTPNTQILSPVSISVMAKEWERSAIVYAFTYEGTGGPGGNRNAGENPSALPLAEFAALGIKGLCGV